MSNYDPNDCVTISLPDWDTNTGGEDSLYVSNDDTITLSDLTYSGTNNVSITGIGVPWSNTAVPGTYTLGSNWNNGISPKIKLDGPGADIEINGESMIDMLRQIEQRLNILKPNEKLESEWEELRALGEQYRALEQHILEKMATWDKLKAMPPPQID